MTQAVTAEAAVTAMLVEQGVQAAPLAPINPAAFTTSLASLSGMLDSASVDAEFFRLIASLVQGAGRTAESVSVASRPRVGYSWHLNLPSCSRCVVLASRLYEFYDGWYRHPGCDDVMLPVRAGDDRFVADPLELARNGQVTGLSADDKRALEDGADFNQVVNVRRKAAGLSEAGRVLSRAGRPTPAAIYQSAGSDRDRALELLARFGYVR